MSIWTALRLGELCVLCLTSPTVSDVEVRPSWLHALEAYQSPWGRLSPEQPLPSAAKCRASVPVLFLLVCKVDVIQAILVPCP